MITLVLLVAAIICFVLAAFGVATSIGLLPLGLAFFAAAHLPWGSINVNTA